MPDFPLKRIPPRQTIHNKRRTDSSQFNVLAHVHLYPPNHNAGAELMLDAMLRYGVDERGWTAHVVTDYPPERSDVWHGVKVRHDKRVANLTIDYRFTQVAITHLDVTRKAVALARRNGRPLVHLVHNAQQLRFNGVDPRQTPLVVFNSQWLSDAVAWPGRSMIVYPPVLMDDYHFGTPHGGSIVLVNLSEAKGAPLFYALARHFPQYRFLGVVGGYGPQILPPDLPNLTILEHQSNMQAVYEEARLVLMPSDSETWGRVSVEAACSGIPSICSPTPGLMEAGTAATHIDVANFDEWCNAIELYMGSEDAWQEASAKALTRAAELDATTRLQLAEWAETMESL